jgi:catechol 2,3-dioxygenase-like lactoylglutathione lyase family enzyme
MTVANETQTVRQAHAIHHVLFPTSDPDRTAEWYGKVFGLRRLNVTQRMSDLTVMLLTNGNFDLHFTPVAEVPTMDPYHFSIEVEDWDNFIAHLEDIGIEYGAIRQRPQNHSKTSELRDPDGHRVEFVWHGDRDW